MTQAIGTEDLLRELHAATDDHEGWTRADSNSWSVNRTLVRPDGYEATLIGNPEGWWWSIWYHGNPVRGLRETEPEASAVTAVQAVQAWLAQELSCSMCSPGHDRGDGRCGRHGKLIVINEYGVYPGQQIRLTVDAAGFFRDDTSEIITRDAGAVLTYDGIDQASGWPRVHRATTMHDGVTWYTGLGREMFEPVSDGS